LREFLADLRSILGPGVLKRVGRKVWEDDCPGLAGQLAYFLLLSLFPFLMFLVSLAGLVMDDPESALGTLTERLGGVLPEDAVRLLADYIDRTLRGAGPGVLLFGILATLWSGWAACDAIIKATNRAYGLRETRPFWKLWGISVLMIFGWVLVVTSLTLTAFGPELGDYVRRLTGLPEVFLGLWGVLRWALAFLAVTLAHAVLYYVAPNARVHFKWITPGGFAATVLILVSSVALSLYVTNIARYDRIYGQAGAIVVLMLWLYVTGLMVLVGAEMNAVLTRVAEEKKGVQLVRPEEASAGEPGA
jgi:membrane protein